MRGASDGHDTAPFPFDIEPVAHEIEPARAGPGEAPLRADLVADHDVAAIADAPALCDGPQAEVEFLPAEEQRLVVAAACVPGGAADGVTGADEGDRIERRRRRVAAG